MRFATRGQRRWRPALAVLTTLAFWLVACSASQGATPTVASATIAAPATAVALANSPTASMASPTAIATVAPVATAAASANAAATTTAPASPTVGATIAATSPATVAATTATPDPAVAAVLAYLDARARANVTALTSLSCKTWKPKAVTEAISFRSMNAKLIGVTCQVNGSAGSFILVGCGGKMVTTYGTESRDWDLSAFVYQVITEDGQWKMCGYH